MAATTAPTNRHGARVDATGRARRAKGQVSAMASPGTGATSLETSLAGNYREYLRPIEAPFVFSGFSDATMARYANEFAAAGIVPVMGTGSSSGEKQPEPIEAGSAVSAVLVRGDMDIAATCTVTYVDPKRLLACGHPLRHQWRDELRAD